MFAQHQQATEADAFTKGIYRRYEIPIIVNAYAVGIVSRFVWAQSTEIARGAMRCRQTHPSLEADGDGEDAAKDAIVVTHVVMFTSWDKRNISSSSLYVRVLLPGRPL